MSELESFLRRFVPTKELKRAMEMVKAEYRRGESDGALGMRCAVASWLKGLAEEHRHVDGDARSAADALQDAANHSDHLLPFQVGEP